MKYKAIQYDVSRGRVPRAETVADRLRWLKPYGVNMLCLYMESPVETSVFPGLGCGRTPLNAQRLKKLKALCESEGVSFTPILQILGHQEKLLALEEFKWMGDSGPAMGGGIARNFKIDSPRVRKILFNWIDEIIPHFHPPFVHLGCDEVWSLGVGRDADQADRLDIERRLGVYLSAFNSFLKERGRRMVMWADLIISYPKLLDFIPRDVIIANWGYGTYSEAYERDNKHFAANKLLASRGHPQWVCGNNHAEYVFPAYQRMRKNTAIWRRIARTHKAECFLITDWGSNNNVNPHVLSVLGDQFVLMQLNNGRLILDQFTAEFSSQVLGRRDANFEEAIRLMMSAQQNPRYWPERMRFYGCPFGHMLLHDPAGGRSLARRFGAYTLAGLELFLSDMREAARLMHSVEEKGIRRPDFLEALKMLSSRLVMIALRLRLWFEYAWDTEGPNPERDRRIESFLEEYLDLSEADLKWYSKLWRKENLESEWAKTRQALEAARESIIRLFPKLKRR